MRAQTKIGRSIQHGNGNRNMCAAVALLTRVFVSAFCHCLSVIRPAMCQQAAFAGTIDADRSREQPVNRHDFHHSRRTKQLFWGARCGGPRVAAAHQVARREGIQASAPGLASISACGCQIGVLEERRRGSLHQSCFQITRLLAPLRVWRVKGGLVFRARFFS